MPEINQITDLNGTTYDIRDNSKVNSNQGAANAGKALGIDSTGAVVPVPFSGEDFTGATSSTNGTHGYVPAPEAGMQQYFLKADGTWDAPPGTKLIEKTLDTVTSTSGSYTHTTTISDVSSDMKAVMIELSNPSAFLSDITITPADGSITLSCSSVAGTSTVKVGLLFVAGASAITLSEFDVLAGRIGTLGDLQTTAKTSLVAATNENTQSIANIVNVIYPIGSIYMSVSSTSPSVLFGGTWQRLEDCFLIGASTNYSAGVTGGAESVSYTPSGSVENHTLTTSEIPSHSHSLNSHKHSIGAHSHGLNSHTHNYSKSATSTGSNNSNTGSTTIDFANGAAKLEFNGTAIEADWKTGVTSWTATSRRVTTSSSGGSGTYTSGVALTGGQAHTHTLNNHTHSIALTTTASDGPSKTNTADSTAFDSGAASGNTGSAGSDGSHNHGFTGTAATINTMPPYLSVYMWKRTA